MSKKATYLNKLRDTKFYLEKFCKVKTKQGGLRPFILKSAQLDIFNTIKRNSRVIILKARQIGFSTAITGLFYHTAIMKPGTTSALIGYNREMTAELLDKVKTFYNTTPASLRPTIEYNSRHEISFPKIESKIIVLPSTTNVGRGYTIHNALLTELAFWEDAEEKMTALENSIPADGKIVIESCVTGDTIVFTNNGPYYIKDVHNWGNYPLGFSKGKEIKIDGHYGIQPTDVYYNSGIKKGFRIKTRCGFELGMSSIHKLLVFRNGELIFVKASDLKTGDRLSIKYGQESWGNDNYINWIPTPYGFNKKYIKLFNEKNVTSDLAYLIGLILGDGYVDFKQGRVVITTIDKDVYEFLLKWPLGLKFFQSKGEDSYHYVCKNQSFVEFLSKYVGMHKVVAKQKEIPSIVFRWSRDNIVSFLSGLFDADGCCRRDRGNVSLTSTSKNIIRVTQILLLNFGIISRIYSHVVEPTKKLKLVHLYIYWN